ncbi:MAG: glucosidase, partial [Xanthobacteraceae bacterium]
MTASETAIDRERERVREMGDDLSGWRRWGPYVSDRSWGTVREDYSHDGNAWAYLTYDKARAKAYRWGDDGIAGLCDRYQLLCFAPAFRNERDPHLKERLFGVNPYEGNHGEDVKEYYFHVDNTPTHSYMCLLYKYPQAAFPYRELIEHNQRRAGQGPEYELLDTGVFDGDCYFDIFIEYAKADPEDLAIRITAHNRGPAAAPLHILPTLWFRNTWAWGPTAQPEPKITCELAGGMCLVTDDGGTPVDPNMPEHYRLGPRYLYGPAAPALFTDNETHGERVYGPGNTSRKLHTKDAFHRAICESDPTAVCDRCGTK